MCVWYTDTYTPKCVATKHFPAPPPKGMADAQYNLGECFFKGRGVAKDRDVAVEWFQLAAQQGHEVMLAHAACLPSLVPYLVCPSLSSSLFPFCIVCRVPKV